MKRVALALALTLAIAGAALVYAQKTRLVRVGGMGNACTCTQRIEP